MKEEKFTHSRKPCHRRVCGEFGNLRGQHNREKNRNKKHTDYVPNCNCQQRSSPDAEVRHQQAGSGQGGAGWIVGAQGKDRACMP